MSNKECSDFVYKELTDLGEEMKSMNSGLSSSLIRLTETASVLSTQIEGLLRFHIKILYLLFILVFGLIFGPEIVHKVIGSVFAVGG